MNRFEKVQYSDAWVEFVRTKANWNKMITLTFEKSRYEGPARACLSNFLKLIKGFDTNLKYFFTLETNEYRECHFHGIMESCIPKGMIAAHWLHGFKKIDDITRKDEVISYIIKYLHKRDGIFIENFPIPRLTKSLNLEYDDSVVLSSDRPS